MKHKKNAYDYFIYGFTGLFALFCLLPMVLVLIVSFSEESSVLAKGYSFWPNAWSIEAYRTLFHSTGTMLRSYGLTFLVTVVGTLGALLITTCAGYALSTPGCKLNNTLSFFFYFTLLFNGGIVPWYIICRNLGLVDNIWALIVPSLMFNPFNMFLVRNYMKELPHSLRESAMIDGAGSIRIAFQIVVPLSVPVLAAVSLFYALAYWNNWWNAIMLIDNPKLYPLQYMLFKLQSEISMLKEMQFVANTSGTQLPGDTLKMATVIATAAPILLLYPMLQRFFVHGLVMGSVKG